MTITITPMTEAYAEGFHATLDAVARERRYLARETAPSVDKVRAFVRDNIRAGNPHFAAVRDGSDVVGWCDIVRLHNPFTAHTGILGMGVRADARGQRIGAALLDRALNQVWARRFTRIELTVFATNTSAIRLYEQAGFIREGELRDAACFDGEYSNSYIMGLMNHQAPSGVPDQHTSRKHD